MNNVTETFLLVSSSVGGKQLLRFAHGQGQKREQKDNHQQSFSSTETAG